MGWPGIPSKCTNGERGEGWWKGIVRNRYNDTGCGLIIVESLWWISWGSIRLFSVYICLKLFIIFFKREIQIWSSLRLHRKCHLTGTMNQSWGHPLYPNDFQVLSGQPPKAISNLSTSVPVATILVQATISITYSEDCEGLLTGLPASCRNILFDLFCIWEIGGWSFQNVHLILSWENDKMQTANSNKKETTCTPIYVYYLSLWRKLWKDRPKANKNSKH